LNIEQLEKAKHTQIAYAIDELVEQELAGGEGEGEFDVTQTVLDDNRGLFEDDFDTKWDFLAKDGEYLSTRQYLVLQNDDIPENIRIVFRGRNSDTTDAIDKSHIKKTMLGQTRDYSELDTLMENINKAQPNANIDVVSYSNGGPKGMYVSSKYDVPHYSIDPVLGPKEVALLNQRTANSAKLEIVRTTKPAIAMTSGMTTYEILNSKPPANTEIITVEPLKVQSYNPVESVIAAHNDLANYHNWKNTYDLGLV